MSNSKRKKARTPTLVLLARLRKRQLERIFIDRWHGRTLPDDDAGRGDLRLMADHLALIDKRYIATWASLWARWLSKEEADALIEEVGDGKYWTADDLGKEMNLDEATRYRLKAWHLSAVDSTKEQLDKSRRQRQVAKRREQRAETRALRPAPASKTKPWVALGMSRASWYAHGKPTPPDAGLNLTPISLELGLASTFVQGHEAATLSRGAQGATHRCWWRDVSTETVFPMDRRVFLNATRARIKTVRQFPPEGSSLNGVAPGFV
jgi:hypothetical protein